RAAGDGRLRPPPDAVSLAASEHAPVQTRRRHGPSRPLPRRGQGTESHDAPHALASPLHTPTGRASRRRPRSSTAPSTPPRQRRWAPRGSGFDPRAGPGIPLPRPRPRPRPGPAPWRDAAGTASRYPGTNTPDHPTRGVRPRDRRGLPAPELPEAHGLLAEAGRPVRSHGPRHHRPDRRGPAPAHGHRHIAREPPEPRALQGDLTPPRARRQADR